MTRFFPVFVPRVLCLLLVGAACRSALGVLMPSGSNDQDYRDAGAAFAANHRALSLRMTPLSGPRGFATVTPINAHFGITSGHAVTGTYANATYQVGTGSDANNPTSWISISEVKIYPGYVNGSRSGPDIAVLKFAVPLTGFVPVTIGSASLGEVVSAAGYGFAFRVGDPIPTARDGFIRGWNAEVVSGAPQNSSDLFYDLSYGFFSGITRGGKVLNGDSGGPIFNPAGQLVGLNTAQTGNQNQGDTIYLVLSQPDVLAWIQANTVIPTVVAPTMASYTCTAPSSGQPPRFTGTLTGGHPSGTARLEASRDLGVADPWTELANTPLDATGSATFTNVPDNRPESATASRLFYRIVSEPAP